MTIKLSQEQEKAFDLIMKWLEGPEKRFVLGGYAGTGKSTLAGILSNMLENVTFCAYTGKAASVLRSKGCSADTIHGSIYKLINSDDDKPQFILDHESPIKYSSLVIVDEFSMLNEEIVKDLESLAVKVLYLGDPFQLPPVSGESYLQPDHVLTEVHRQALDSPILKAATDVREGNEIDFQSHESFKYQHRSYFDESVYLNADQIIVGYNKTRTSFNKRMRLRLGLTDKNDSNPYPVKGDKIICLRNNRDMGIFNGNIDYCPQGARVVDDLYLRLSFGKLKNIQAWRCLFDGEAKVPFYNRECNYFDYGYAITAHKSQGSEFDSVVIYNQPIGRGVERQRWLYTALTRSKKKCILVEP